MNGACANFARRREISVLPTPVGPIIIIFFGAISSRKSSGTSCRRQRLRRAIATARLASLCPTIYRSSSETISRGVITGAGGRFDSGSALFPSSFMEYSLLAISPGNAINREEWGDGVMESWVRIPNTPILHHSNVSMRGRVAQTEELSESCSSSFGDYLRQLFESKLLVGIDAEAGCHAHRLFSDHARIEVGMLDKHASGGQRIIAARPNGDDVVIRLDDIAGA